MASESEPETEVVALVAEELYSLAHDDGVLWAEFSPDGERIVTASKDGTARVWSDDDGQILATLRGHQSVVVHAAFSPDSRRIVTASMDHTARVWDVVTGNETAEPLRHTHDVNYAVFSPDGSRIVSTTENAAKVWDATNGALLFSLAHPRNVLYAEFSPSDGSRIVTVGFDDTARVWSTEDGRQISMLRGHQDSLWHAAFSPDGMRIVTGSISGTPRVFDAASGRRIIKLEGHKGNVLHVGYSPNGSSILTAGTDGTARVWNAEDGQELAILRGDKAGMKHAAFSRDSRRIVTASKDNAACVWDVATGAPLAVLRGHEAELLAAAFSPDGTRIVTASFDGTALVWSIRPQPAKTVLTNGELRSKRLEEDAEPSKTVDAITRTMGANRSPPPPQVTSRTRRIAQGKVRETAGAMFLGIAVLGFFIFLGIHLGPYIRTLLVNRLSPVVVPKSHFVGDHGKNKKLLVFVHGVMGDMDNTWVNAETHASWPELIAGDKDLSDLDVFVYGYASPAMGDASTIERISVRFLQQLKDYRFFDEYKEVNFVTHSMGGIITKRALVMLDTPAESSTLQRVHTVIYISVPSNGADLAALASWISDNPQFKGMSPKSASDFLESVESDWANLLRQRPAPLLFPRTFSAYETLPTGPVQVVPALYTSELSDGRVVGFDYNHIDIVKPKDRDAEVYQWVKARLLEKVSVQPTAFSETVSVLQQIVDAKKMNDWEKVSSLAESELTRAPDLLILYFEASLADWHLCRNNSATEKNDYFLAHATLDPRYKSPIKDALTNRDLYRNNLPGPGCPDKSEGKASALKAKADALRESYMAQHPDAQPAQVVTDVNKELAQQHIPVSITILPPSVPCTTKHGIVVHGDSNHISNVHSYACFTEDVINVSGARNEIDNVDINPPERR
jgi:WD40 repeat protein